MALGKRTVELAVKWAPSAAVYGTALGAGFLYFSDWKLIVTLIPYYNTKFSDK